MDKFIYFWCILVCIIGAIVFLPVFLFVAGAWGILALLAMIG